MCQGVEIFVDAKALPLPGFVAKPLFRIANPSHGVSAKRSVSQIINDRCRMSATLDTLLTKT